MIYYIVRSNFPVFAAIGLLFAFMCTCLLIAKLSKYLPKDIGRDFAHDGKYQQANQEVQALYLY